MDLFQLVCQYLTRLVDFCKINELRYVRKNKERAFLLKSTRLFVCFCLRINQLKKLRLLRYGFYVTCFA